MGGPGNATRKAQMKADHTARGWEVYALLPIFLHKEKNMALPTTPEVFDDFNLNWKQGMGEELNDEDQEAKRSTSQQNEYSEEHLAGYEVSQDPKKGAQPQNIGCPEEVAQELNEYKYPYCEVCHHHHENEDTCHD